MAAEDENWIAVGEVVGSFGLRGHLKLELLTDYPERFKTLEALYLGPDHRRFPLEESRPHKSLYVVKLTGINSPEQANALRGREVAIPRAEAVELPEGHYFLEELIGIEVVSDEGTALGSVTEVLRTGSNDVYVVGTGNSALLVPGIRDAVLDLDLKQRRLVVAGWILESRA